MLHPFGIRPHSLWPGPRRRSDKHLKSAKGYVRADFEKAWRDYASGAGTPAHGDKVVPLRRR
jgi:hypothetical protein